MLNFLIKKFIPRQTEVRDSAVRRAYGVLCGAYGIFLNLLLFAGKYAAGLLSGSVAVTVDAFNNLSDAASSVITLLGFTLAGKKPDPGHPYGHGRLEYLAGLGLSVLIIVMGVELGRGSIGKILRPQPLSVGWLPAAILAASIAVKLYMASYNRRIGRTLGSAAIAAAGADSLSDAVSTAVVLCSMGVFRLFGLNIDGWAGLAVACFIVYTGVTAARDTLSPLLGQAPDPELVQGIEDTVRSHPEVLGIHDLLVHDYGPGRRMVSLHAEVDGRGELFALHDAIDSAETEIQERFGCSATIHMDPILPDGETAQRRLETEELLRQTGCTGLHDFRLVPGPTHSKLIFDASFPAADPRSDRELAALIRQTVSEAWPDCGAVVRIDRDYTT